MSMQPSIFGKDLASIEFADIVTFCNEQPKEGLGLDYKKDLSSLSNVVKTLVSFANTNGGWLIVGVEDEDDAPKLPVTGMKNDDNFEQRINNSIVASVSPIVLPTYKKCVSPDGKQALLVAYMPPSQSAPHFMEYKGKHVLFIRVADRSKSQEWEEYASAPQWEMLRNRRQASIDLRGQLLDMMKSAFQSQAFNRDMEKEMERPANLASALSPVKYTPRKHYRGSQTITLLPMYPTEQIGDVGTVRHMITSEAVHNGITMRRPQTPDHRGYDTKIYQNGAYIFHNDEPTDKYYFFGLDTYGTVMNVDPIELHRSIKEDDGGTKHIWFTDLQLIVMQIVGTLNFAYKSYQSMGLVGNLLFHAEFSGRDKCLMYFPMTNPQWAYNVDNPPENITGYYSVRREIDTNVLADEEAFKQFVAGVAKEILHSFNYGTINEDLLTSLITQAARSR